MELMNNKFSFYQYGPIQVSNGKLSFPEIGRYQKYKENPSANYSLIFHNRVNITQYINEIDHLPTSSIYFLFFNKL